MLSFDTSRKLMVSYYFDANLLYYGRSKLILTFGSYRLSDWLEVSSISLDIYTTSVLIPIFLYIYSYKGEFYNKYLLVLNSYIAIPNVW